MSLFTKQCKFVPAKCLAGGETLSALMPGSLTQKSILWPKCCMQSWNMLEKIIAELSARTKNHNHDCRVLNNHTRQTACFSPLSPAVNSVICEQAPRHCLVNMELNLLVFILHYDEVLLQSFQLSFQNLLIENEILKRILPKTRKLEIIKLVHSPHRSYNTYVNN